MSYSVSRRLLVVALAFSTAGVTPVAAQSGVDALDESASRVDGDALGPDSGLDEAADLQTVAPIVSTARGTAADVPSALATEYVSWQDSVSAPVDFQDLITRVAGVGATGQNGLFETFSIRGSGGSGILVLVGGMPITAQRRAGVPVAFVEPSLLGEINVTRGPATVHFGPGALGGAISIEPRWFDHATASVGYAGSGNESSVMAGYGNQSFSIAAARHRAGDSEAANGTPLNTSFDRLSASLQYRAELGDFAFDALLLPSQTDDIGKSNSRFPARDTTYPEDDHVIGRLRLQHANGFSASVYGHDQSLLTYNQRPGRPDTFAFIESLDYGTTVQQTLERGDISYNLGVEYLGRRDVNGFDAVDSLSNRSFSLRDASEDAWSLFGLVDWRITPELALEFGARHTSIDQTQTGAEASDSDQAYTLGAAWTPTERSRWTLSLASGYRFATLEERYFTGITAVGEIVGDPNLSTEQSRGIDLGYAWQSGTLDGVIHVWQTRIDDLIQLFEIAEDVNGYTNIGSAKLHGAEGSVGWSATSNLSLRASATLVRSKDELSGDPLYGSPPLSASLEARYEFTDVTLGAFYTHRWAMDRPGFEEVERDAVDILDLDLHWRIDDRWNLQLYLRNALDEDYFATADELSTFGQERSLGFNLVWNAH
jgi:iron complex outermembrane receptor protein